MIARRDWAALVTTLTNAMAATGSAGGQLGLLWVKFSLASRFERPSIGVRSSFNSGHEIKRQVQWRFVPTADAAADGDPCLRGRGRPLQEGTGERCLSEASIRLKQILLS